MELLYDRVLIKKEKSEEYINGLSKHILSNDNRIEDISIGIVEYIGVDCIDVKVGDRVVWLAYMDKFLEVEFGVKHVELRESQILGIIDFDTKIGY